MTTPHFRYLIIIWSQHSAAVCKIIDSCLHKYSSCNYQQAWRCRPGVKRMSSLVVVMLDNSGFSSKHLPCLNSSWHFVAALYRHSSGSVSGYAVFITLSAAWSAAWKAVFPRQILTPNRRRAHRSFSASVLSRRGKRGFLWLCWLLRAGSGSFSISV